MIKNKRSFYLLFFLPLILMSCSTILRGRNNRIVITSTEPITERYSITLNDSLIAEEPGKYKIRIKNLPLGSSLKVYKNDVLVKEQVLDRKIHQGYVLANIFTTGGIGLFVDVASGTIYRVYPRRYNLDGL